MESDLKTTSWLDKPLSDYLPTLTFETLLIVIILALAFFTRFYDLGVRVMSHDEVNHVVPGFELFAGRGYRHDPVTHGPMQMELLALSYFLMGDNDFSSRVPAALFSVAVIGFIMIYFKRYLGRAGSLLAGFFFLISPFMMFYGRYTRDEGFVQLFGVMLLFGLLHFLENGKEKIFYLIVAVLSLYFCTMEAAYIFAAQILIFLGAVLIWEMRRNFFIDSTKRTTFLTATLVTLGLLIFYSFAGLYISRETAGGIILTGGLFTVLFAEINIIQLIMVLLFAGMMTGLVFMAKALLTDIHPEKVLANRVTRLLVIIISLMLPLLAAFPIYVNGWNPLDYASIGMVHTSIYLVLTTIPAAFLGYYFGLKNWIKYAAVFFGIFIVLYTTFFTNGAGFFTGIVGGLGYWLSQQGVQRGSQPWYYYGLITIPIYEFLAALGTILALYFAARYRKWWTFGGYSPARQPDEVGAERETQEKAPATPIKTEPTTGTDPLAIKVPVILLLLYWSLTSLVAFSVAGEKMPWLTIYIAQPMLLAAGWGLGYLVDSTNWEKILEKRGLIAAILMVVFLFAFFNIFNSLLGIAPPFQGNTVEQLQATSTFIFAIFAAGASLYGIIYCLKGWHYSLALRWITAIFFSLLALLTIRAAVRASFIEYDHPTEYLVYAHAARGPKEILAQVEEISQRLTSGLDIEVAYDNDGLYPYWWYFRNYPNHHWFSEPTRELTNYPLIIASSRNWGKLESILRENYISYEYQRLWWPNMDYMGLTWERLKNMLVDPKWRNAIWEIWLNRNYTPYGELKGTDELKLATWSPSEKLRLYIRKDIVSKIWNYGVLPSVQETVKEDPYVAGMTQFTPDQVIGSAGSETGQFNAPRSVAVAPDGSFYVADSRNNRVQHFSRNGDLINSWGTFSNTNSDQAPSGTFNEPWGVAVGPDGSVFVADTWNNRIQKFTADGKFIIMWGRSGLAEDMTSFYGPRGIAVDSQGKVYITDTGNKRVVVFDSNGNPITQFGSVGIDPGFFDEPVGIAVGKDGKVYVADTWNQRIQVFAPDATGENFSPSQQIEVDAWFGQSVENKPFLAVDETGRIFITDPEGYRVLEFNPDGSFLRGWGSYSTGSDGFGLPAGIAVDSAGGVWVSDAGNNILLHFVMPAE